MPRRREHRAPKSANETLFIGRDREQKLFRTAYIDAPTGSELPILVFYGPAGQGKTWLLNRFATTATSEVDGRAALPVARIDFDRNYRRPVMEYLASIRDQLGVPAPGFDLAMTFIAAKTGHAVPKLTEADEGSVEAFAELSLEDALGYASDIPGAASVARLARLALRLYRTPEHIQCFKGWVKSEDGKQRTRELVAATPERIEANLPRDLASDLLQHLPRREGLAGRALILLDSFEHLRRGNLSGLQQFTDVERWVFDFWDACRAEGKYGASHPFVLFVIGGREPLDWETREKNVGALGALRQDAIAGFSNRDAVAYLRKRGVVDEELQREILHTCTEAKRTVEVDEPRYHALALGLCCDTVDELQSNGESIGASQFELPPGSIDKIAERFLQSLDEMFARKVRRLARTLVFDEYALRALCGAGDPDQNAVDRRRLLGYSFVQEAYADEDLEGAWFQLHAVMRLGFCTPPASNSARNELGEFHRFWHEHWEQRSTNETDTFASFAWFHRWCSEPEPALDAWKRLAETARASLNMSDHARLLDWWSLTDLETKPPEEKTTARALVELGQECQETTLFCSASPYRRAIDAYHAALSVYTEDKFPIEWAWTLNNLGAALGEQSRRAGSEQGAMLLAQAIDAYQASLRVRTEEALPELWAWTLNNLGATLVEQGQRTEGEQRATLLSQAVDTLRASLRVHTEENLPLGWAETQNAIGVSLQFQGAQTGGEQGAILLLQAVDAHRASLRVHTEDNLPRAWARTQNHLGNALQNRGIRTKGAQGAKLLSQAVDAYRASLRVYTEHALPLEWARNLNHLGAALEQQSRRTDGEQKALLLLQAVDVHRGCLRVATEDELPQDWAFTQYRLGIALEALGNCKNDITLLETAAEAYSAALRVYTEEHSSYFWNRARRSLERIQGALSYMVRPA